MSGFVAPCAVPGCGQGVQVVLAEGLRPHTTGYCRDHQSVPHAPRALPPDEPQRLHPDIRPRPTQRRMAFVCLLCSRQARIPTPEGRHCEHCGGGLVLADVLDDAVEWR